MLSFTTVDSPLGPLRLIASDDALVGVDFADLPPPRGCAGAAPAHDSHPILARATRELAEYFAGERRVFTAPRAARGTAFQRRVWRALEDIPFGDTVSYGLIARRVGAPSAARAVGAANGRNPLAIIVPCHRVVGERGSLTGYAGGLDRKRWLLEHERRVHPSRAGGARSDRADPSVRAQAPAPAVELLGEGLA